MADTALFSIAEARAFDKAQLTSGTDYLDAAITAKEAEIREWMDRACGVNFIRTTHTAEIHDGEGSNFLEVDWPLISSVSAISVDGVAFTAGELSTTDYDSGLAIDPKLPIITRRSGCFTAGWSNVSVTYVAGYEFVPDLIHRAALLICTYEMPATNLSPAAESYDADGISISFGRGDGFGRQWSKIPEVMKAIRLYDRSMPGIA
jgi:hypothetical protein